MKRIVLLLAVISICVSSFAQRLNKDGLKMVSEIESIIYGSNFLFKFQYDEKDNLTRMTIYKYKKSSSSQKLSKEMSPAQYKEHEETLPPEYVLYRDFIMDDKGLSIHTYDIEPTPQYETVLDREGNIASITYFDEWEIGSFRRVRCDFFYESDGKRMWLSGYDRTEAGKRNGQNSWHNSSCGTLHHKMFYYNGFLKESYSDNQERFIKDIDYSHINDTNINLYAFPVGWGGDIFGSAFMKFLAVADWLHCRSKYFLKDDKAYFDYDDKGNLIVFGCGDNGNRSPKAYHECKITIKYLE